ncbi:MAG TPA: Ig domain-containing protein, partial [Bryobacteraceae bacterium]|nr:Ig domain-containing protein [Bryobacteraceae bacterium]
LITASGGAAPYTFTTGDPLPAGITLATDGTLSGTPTVTGTFDFTVTATDNNGCTGTIDYSLTISSCPAITLSPATLPSGTVNSAYNQVITASGGAAPYTFTTGDPLPAGITLAADGTLSGTPTASGTFNITVTATDNTGCTGQQAYTLNITSCLFCDDFEDGVLAGDWTYIKPAWNEAGGVLTATPANRKAIGVASPVFAGCSACYMESTMQTAGGAGNRVWMLGWYVDSRNTMELLMKEETNKWILKERINGSVVAKQKATATINPNTLYRARVAFDGTQFQVTVDGTPLITLPAHGAHNGTVGFQAKKTVGTFGEVTVN